MIKKEKNIKILLFIRENCEYSDKVKKYFNKDNFQLNTFVSKKMGEQIPKEVLKIEPDYIISFRSLFILPKNLLEKVSQNSINFHPGPPKYPGSGSVNLALYNNDLNFGVTAHLINEKIDNGKVIDVLNFEIKEDDNVETLLNKTHKKLYELFLKVSDSVFYSNKEFIDMKLSLNKNLTWNGKANSISTINELQKLNFDISIEELKRRIRSIHSKNYPLYFELDNKKFFLNN
jgi:methionyl-tRNA formyltransferase